MTDDKAAKEAVTNALYRAAIDFVQAYGGSVAVPGSVFVRQHPEDREFNYELCIRITGRKPEG